jgi:hypothetical protein
MRQNRRPSSFRVLYMFFAVGGLLLIALLSIPVLDGPHSRQYANEASAVSKLRAITTLEKKFAAAHLEKGFTCELYVLRPTDNEQKPVDYDPLRFLDSGTSAGYKFVLGNCRTNAKGVVVHYEVTAVPVEHGRRGFHAFCTDDSGLLWYDAEGSATKCLSSRRVLKN